MRRDPVKWDSASEKFKETVEMRPSSVVRCNSYGPIFLSVSVREPEWPSAHRACESNEPDGEWTQPELGVIQEYRNGNE